MQTTAIDLSVILGPISEAEFFEQYWERSPMHVSRADPAHFGCLLSLSMIETLLSSQALYFPSVQLVRLNEPVASSSYTDAAQRIIAHRLLEYHRQGATIVVSQAHDRIPELADFRRAVQAALGLRCQTNVYLSPPGKQGFNAHYDSHDVFILQVSGTKTFNFYGGGIELPYAHDGFDATRHSCGELQESIVLEAGDTLYIPRGVMHDAVASDTSSLHITLGVHAITLRDAMLEMVQQLTQQDVAYRHSVPINWLRQKGGVAASLQDLVNLQEAVNSSLPLTEVGESQQADSPAQQPQVVPPVEGKDVATEGQANVELDTWLRPVFTIRQLEKALSSLVDTIAIDSAPDCRGMLTTVLPERAEKVQCCGEAGQASGEVGLSSTIRLRHSRLTSLEQVGSTLRCRTHGQVLEFADPLGEAVDWLRGVDCCAVSMLPGLDDEQKLAVCERLLKANLLELISL